MEHDAGHEHLDDAAALAAAHADALPAGVAQCPECRALVAALRVLARQTSEAVPTAVPLELQQRVLAKLARHNAVERFMGQLVGAGATLLILVGIGWMIWRHHEAKNPMTLAQVSFELAPERFVKMEFPDERVSGVLVKPSPAQDRATLCARLRPCVREDEPAGTVVVAVAASGAASASAFVGLAADSELARCVTARLKGLTLPALAGTTQRLGLSAAALDVRSPELP